MKDGSRVVISTRLEHPFPKLLATEIWILSQLNSCTTRCTRTCRFSSPMEWKKPSKPLGYIQFFYSSIDEDNLQVRMQS